MRQVATSHLVACRSRSRKSQEQLEEMENSMKDWWGVSTKSLSTKNGSVWLRCWAPLLAMLDCRRCVPQPCCQAQRNYAQLTFHQQSRREKKTVPPNLLCFCVWDHFGTPWVSNTFYHRRNNIVDVRICLEYSSRMSLRFLSTFQHNSLPLLCVNGKERLRTRWAFSTCWGASNHSLMWVEKRWFFEKKKKKSIQTLFALYMTETSWLPWSKGLSLGPLLDTAPCPLWPWDDSLQEAGLCKQLSQYTVNCHPYNYKCCSKKVGISLACFSSSFEALAGATAVSSVCFGGW